MRATRWTPPPATPARPANTGVRDEFRLNTFPPAGGNGSAKIDDTQADIQRLQDEQHPALSLVKTWTAFVRSSERHNCGKATLGQYESKSELFRDWLTREHPEAVLLRDVTSRIELTGKDNQPFVPAVVAPLVQFIIPDNGRGPSVVRPAQIEEHVQEAGG